MREREARGERERERERAVCLCAVFVRPMCQSLSLSPLGQPRRLSPFPPPTFISLPNSLSPYHLTMFEGRQKSRWREREHAEGGKKRGHLHEVVKRLSVDRRLYLPSKPPMIPMMSFFIVSWSNLYMITKVMKEEVYLTTKLRHALLIGVETTQRGHTVSSPRLELPPQCAHRRPSVPHIHRPE